MEKKLPPQVRQRINKLAHRLALAAEADIRDRLTAHFSSDANLAALGLRAFTDEDWQRVTLTDAELLACLASRAIELPD